MNETQRLRAEHIESVLPRSTHPTEPSNQSDRQSGTLGALAQATAEAERSAITAALNATSGNKVAAARILGISRAALYQKLETLGLTGTKRISSGNS